jgi:ketosteroid isomerase-like protein
MLTVYTDDLISLAPDGSMVRGRAALREFWVWYLARASKVHVEHERLALEVEGDSAWEFSSYRQRIEWRDGSVLEDSGKWLTVRKRAADGSWKTHMGSWTSDRGALTVSP